MTKRFLMSPMRCAGTPISFASRYWLIPIGRPGAIICAVASLGLLVAKPMGRLLRRLSARPGTRPSPLDRLPNPWLTPLGVGALQLGVVYLTSRVAGLRYEAVPAAVIAGSTLAVTALACALTAPARAASDSGAGGG